MVQAGVKTSHTLCRRHTLKPIAWLFAVLVLSLVAHPAAAATFTVSSLSDSGAGSLRQAILDANAAGGTNSIGFTTGTGTVTLTSDLPPIMTSVTIDSAGVCTIDGAGLYRAFFVGKFSGTSPQAIAVTIANLTIRNTKAKGGDGATGFAGAGGGMGAGGAIFVCPSASVTINNVTFLGNNATGGNGGGNTANGFGGGGGLGGNGAGNGFSGGGGGGLGVNATGGINGAAGAAGILTGAASGGASFDGAAGGANGGGGGGANGGVASAGGGGIGGAAGLGSGGFGGAGGFGGGGGGGGLALVNNSFIQSGGGAGGYGGGGGAAPPAIAAGNGGFGGGGGGGGAGASPAGNAPGYGGGYGNQQTSPINGGNGGGGAGFGGAVFVAPGGALTASGCWFDNTNSVTGGLAGGSGATNGSAEGSALFLDQVTMTLFGGITGAIDGTIGGSGGLTVTGQGPWVLSADNTYTGVTTINSGVLVLGSNGTTGSVAGNIVDNGILQFNHAATYTYGGNISGTGSVELNTTAAVVLTGTNTFSGLIAVPMLETLQIGNGGTTGSLTADISNNGTVVFDRSDNITYAGTLTGLGSVMQIGAGTLTLSGTNSYLGGTTITSGTIVFANANSFGTGAIAVNGGGVKWGAGNTADISAALTIGANGAILDTNGNNLTFASSVTGTGTLTKTGAGTLTLSAANAFSGLTILGGSVAAGARSDFGNLGETITLNGGQLQFTAGLTLSQGIAVGGAGGTIANGGFSSTLQGVLSGSGALTLTGSGTTTIATNGTYSGTITLGAGTLNIAAALPSASVVVQSGATLQATGTIGSVVIQPGGNVSGSLNVTNGLTFPVGSTFNATLSSATNYTQLSVGSANLTAAPTLVVSLAGGYVPPVGTVFTLISGTVSGTFNGLPEGAVFTVNGVYFQIHYGSAKLTVINPPPVVTSAATASGMQGSSFNYAITATNSPASYSIAAGTLPAGLTLNSTTGVISGSPSGTSSAAVTIAATNAAGTGTKTLTFSIAPLTPVTVTLGNLSQTYDGTPKAITVTTSPGGIATNVAYVGSPGAPTQAGTYTVVASVNQTGYSGSALGTLTIGKATPVVSWATPAPIMFGTSLSGAQLNATATVPGTFTYSPAAGAILDAGTQTLQASFVPSDTTDFMSPIAISVPLTVNKLVSSTSAPSYPIQSIASGPLTLSATNSAGLPLTYSLVSGPATLSGNVLSFTGVPGVITVQASSPMDGNIVGSTSTITIDVAAPNALVNVSSRGQVGSGDAALIVGFSIAGSAPKTVLLRGIGPTLATLGVNGVLANPTLQLFDANNKLVLGNTGWGGGLVFTSAFNRVGAFPLPANSADDAAIVTLPPGNYTAVVSAPAGTSGAALAEVYDLSSNPLLDPMAIVNLSCRGQVTSSNGGLIAGFVVTGTAPKPVLIRGVGPTLANLGVNAPLAAPLLTVYDSTRTAIAQNSAWGTPTAVAGSPYTPASGADVAAAAGSVGAFTLPAGSKDAAMLLTLPPGAYTAQLSSADGSSGIALVEIYAAH